MKSLILNFVQRLFRIIPIRHNKLIFIDYYGMGYGCSPKSLSDYINEHKPNWKIVWCFTNPDKFTVKGIKKIRYFSLLFFYELATSKILVTNFRMPVFYKKRKGQKYVQTWHSSLRLKKVEGDVESVLKPNYIEMAKHDSNQIDLFVSGCRITSDTIKRAFWYRGEIIESGTPRIDTLIHNSLERIKEIRSDLGIALDMKVLLFAPTFRNCENKNYLSFDTDKLLKLINDHQKPNWIVLNRFHPHDYNKKGDLMSKDTIDVTNYSDVQDLMLIADILVTDYSGLMFDFAYTQKPCFLYVPDLEEYIRSERSLYFDIKSLPFPMCFSIEELAKNIIEFNQDTYEVATKSFLSEIGTFENGEACKKITARITEWIEKTK